MSGKSRYQAGFTLLELLIGITLFLTALATIGITLDSNRRSYLRNTTKMDLQQNARLALSVMTREIRMAGYFPENFAAPPAAPPLTHAVEIATDNAMAIHGDADSSGASNVFLYCLDGTTVRRGKAPDGDSAAYWCPATEILAENVTDLRFAYFDENDVPIPAPPSSPYSLDGQSPGSVPDYSDVSQRGAVRRLVIVITVSEEVPGQGTQTYNLGSEVRLRNVR